MQYGSQGLSTHVADGPPTPCTWNAPEVDRAAGGAGTDCVPFDASTMQPPQMPAVQTWMPVAQSTMPSCVPSSMPHARVEPIWQGPVAGVGPPALPVLPMVSAGSEHAPEATAVATATAPSRSN